MLLYLHSEHRRFVEPLKPKSYWPNARIKTEMAECRSTAQIVSIIAQVSLLQP